MRCGFVHIPEMGSDPDPEDKAWACKNEATHTCCDYGGKVCEKHKCRCSKPLPTPEAERILAAVVRKAGGL